ncbi:lipoprotein [Mesorhizobium sp. 113-1-2]|nr:lipoprotein [Mesorhizobium loti]BCG69795.1 lipoprotein [Mesorhizobium sp. 113-1-2]
MLPVLGSLPASAAEKPVQPEKNPPGDIPDSQVFIDYISPQGFALKVPEGWARSDRADGASFVDKLDGVVVSVSKADAAPTVDSAKADYVAKLEASGRAVRVSAVKQVKLPAGTAIRIVYTSNSEPNAVTNRQVRLENERYLYFKDGKLVALELYAPKGADNVDQWQLMSSSFRWK